MQNIEFYNSPKGEVIVSIDGNVGFALSPKNVDIVNMMYDHIKTHYQEAYAALTRLYSASALNTMYYKYRIVSRFARCNFGEYDCAYPDIDTDVIFHHEEVHCPLRGTGDCQLENIVCKPNVTLPLTAQQMKVFRLYSQGLSTSDIAYVMHLSVHTIDRHRCDIFQKLNIHSIPELILYSSRNNIK